MFCMDAKSLRLVFRKAISRDYTDSFGYLKRELRNLKREWGKTKGSMKVYDSDGKREMILLCEGASLESVVEQLERFCLPFKSGRFFETNHKCYRRNGEYVHNFKIRAGFELNGFRKIDRTGKISYKTDA